jgi:hypothetical protein
MKLFEISVGNDEGWSYFLPKGDVREYITICPHCYWAIEDTGAAKVLIWQGGSDPGDFADATLGTFAKKSVGVEVAKSYPELTVIDVSTESQPGRANSNNRVYSDESIVELTTNLRIALPFDRCTLKPQKRFTPCPLCQRVVGFLDGVELRPVYLAASSGNKPPNLFQRIPRQPGKGVFLYEDELAGQDFFYLGGFLHLHCTEKARDFVVGRGYSHVDLVEIGETIRRDEPIPLVSSAAGP